jgi:pyruvate/2-oxoacid:ferredoxin oxidoreductase beta subunit
MDNNEKGYLEHFGVMGMHWGHRRGPRIGITKSRQRSFNEKDIKRLENGGHLSIGITKARQEAYDKRDMRILKDQKKKLDKGEEKYSEDYKKSRVLKKKSISEMSNSELKELNTRLQLEKQYKDLTKRQISSGEKFVNDALGGLAKQTAANYVSKGISKVVKKAFSKKG